MSVLPRNYHFLLQVTAYPILVGFTSEMFKLYGGLDGVSEGALNLLTGLALVLASASAVAITKFCNRRNLLLTSAAGVAASLQLMALLYFCKDLVPITKYGSLYSWLPPLAFAVYLWFFMVRMFGGPHDL